MSTPQKEKLLKNMENNKSFVAFLGTNGCAKIGTETLLQ